MDDGDRLRIDKWLWFARLTKTRTLAQKLVTTGRVRVNREKQDNAARLVKVGDVLTIALGSRVRVVRISAMATRRGPAAEAQGLFEDLTPAPSPVTTPPPPASNARPTKRDRRNLEKFRGSL
jgi:ribosome-associated heat shock protein Hsp15